MHINRKFMWCCATAAVVGLALIGPAPVIAAPGDPLVAQLNLPNPKFGVSVAVDCRGNAFYTGITAIGQIPSLLHSTDKNGADLGTVPITNAAGGNPVGIDEMAWDEGRQMLWGLQHAQGNPMKVWQVDPNTGVATFQFVANQSNSPGIFRDGITYDGTDDTLYISGDVSLTVEQYTTGGAFIDQITPKADLAGTPLNNISGITAGTGDILYVGTNPFQQQTVIVTVRKSNGDFLAPFVTGDDRVEGLECDVTSFAPLVALWVRDFGDSNAGVPSHINIFEVEPGTCQCGGGITGDDDDDNDDNDDDTPFDCSKPIDALTMIWDGTEAVKIVAHKGGTSATVLATIDNIQIGDEVTVSGMGGTPNDQIWEVFRAGTNTKLGDSTFHISCSDNDMDSADDCGKRQGNGKQNNGGFINDWILEGIVDSDQILDCTP